MVTLGSVSCDISILNYFFAKLNSKKIFYQIDLFGGLEPFWSFFLRTNWANLGVYSVTHLFETFLEFF